MGAVCGCCTDPVDFDGEVDLYHFDLHRAVGKGAFGKVCPSATHVHYIPVSLARAGSSGRTQEVKAALRSKVH